MNIYAFAIIASRNEIAWDRTEVMPIVIAADSPEVATTKAEEQARRKYPKSHGWNIKTSMVQIDQDELLKTIGDSESSAQTRVVSGGVQDSEEDQS